MVPYTGQLTPSVDRIAHLTQGSACSVACGFPLRAATQIALDTVQDFLDQNSCLEIVIFMCYSAADLQVYQELTRELELDRQTH